ncbi:DUF262 domain-containing protein [Jiella pelagia]|uniref:DUF262 domain-containing protein n=1 Tax=Jiella pelagia TaxID=2986949 RepID=A0ABY7C299_9HYPH|nr:DUF262 domain-containing protein [Jiella pelagia]WAP69866.1 DUF262 domain-containing protein [Jiella pelagia]
MTDADENTTTYDDEPDVVDEAVESENATTDAEDKEIVYQINSFGADYLVDGIISRMETEAIYRPDFQRQFVWSVPQASRFIESILLGLPIPGIFLYREESTQRHLIIDGLQRLTTIQSYYRGQLPHSDRVFRLVNVKERFEGKTLDDLEPADQRRFNDATIHATIIQQVAPENDNSSVFYIFDRLNSGGTPLQPQEIRAAVYHGAFQRLLERLNDDVNWRKIFGPKNKRGKDQELILRFLALTERWSTYKSPMKTFLNSYMSDRRHISDEDGRRIEEMFAKTVRFVVENIGDRPFRPSRSLNTAVFDAVMVAIAQNPEPRAEGFSDRYKALLQDDNFQEASSRATADESNVATRIKKAIDYLG